MQNISHLTSSLLVSAVLFAISVNFVLAQRQDESNIVGNVDEVTLNNPLNNISTLEGLLVAILNIFITLMIPVIVFFIILAGFKYVTAQGNPGKIEEATTTFMYAVIGGVVILAAVAIAEIIRNTVAAF